VVVSNHNLQQVSLPPSALTHQNTIQDKKNPRKDSQKNLFQMKLNPLSTSFKDKDKENSLDSYGGQSIEKVNETA